MLLGYISQVGLMNWPNKSHKRAIVLSIDEEAVIGGQERNNRKPRNLSVAIEDLQPRTSSNLSNRRRNTVFWEVSRLYFEEAGRQAVMNVR